MSVLRSGWPVYAVALLAGVAAGLVAHSAVVSGGVALAVAMAWIALGANR
jgi:hypothetical protein